MQPAPPSDAALIAYLLGDASLEDRSSVEAWVAADVSHGDRLVDLAATALAVDQVAGRSTGVSQNSQDKVVLVGPSLTRVRLRAVFALAASVVLVAFTLSRFTQSRLDQEVALAWLDATPGRDASVPEVVDYLDERIASFESLTIASTASDDAELSDPEPFGFSATEPPDWMLAAVTQMSSEDASPEESAL